MHESEARARILRIVGVVALIIGPLSLIVATALQWTMQRPDPSSVTFAVAAAASVFGPLLWLLGIPALIGLARDRGWVLTAVGGLATAIGLGAAIGHLALFFGTSQLGAGGQNALGDALLILFLIAFSLGPVLLAIGLRRAKVVPVWVPVAAIIMTVANFVGGVPAGVVQLVALIATFTPIVIALLRRRPSARQAESFSRLDHSATRGSMS